MCCSRQLRSFEDVVDCFQEQIDQALDQFNQIVWQEQQSNDEWMQNQEDWPDAPTYQINWEALAKAIFDLYELEAFITGKWPQNPFDYLGFCDAEVHLLNTGEWP